MGAHQDQVRGFAQYNLAMNQGLFDRIAGLGDAERKRDMAAFFGSIHGTLNHILLADRIWLGRFAAAFPAMPSLQGGTFVRSFTSLREELYDDFAELRAQRQLTDGVIAELAEELTDDVLAGSMSYRNSQGEHREQKVWIVVAHLFNHQTHHRGQITTLLNQLGHDSGVTDYVAYVQ